MILITQASRLGGSTIMVIPVEVVKKMKIIPREALVIKYDEDKMEIVKARDSILDKDKG